MSKVYYSKSHVDAMRSRLLFIIFYLSLKIKSTIDYTNAHIASVEQDANEQLQAKVTEVALLVEALEDNGNLIWLELKAVKAERDRLATENEQLQKRIEALEAKIKRKARHGKLRREHFKG